MSPSPSFAAAHQRHLDSLLEKDWMRQLFATKGGLAPMLGWRLNYHVRYTQGSPAGFPDQVMIRDRVIFAELKREKGKATDSQIQFLDGLVAAGAEVYLWRPSDLEEIGDILKKRWRYMPRGDRTLPAAADETPLLRAEGEEDWTPASLWVGGSRYDGS